MNKKIPIGHISAWRPYNPKDLGPAICLKNDDDKYIIQTFRKAGCSTIRNLFYNLYGETANETERQRERVLGHPPNRNLDYHYNDYFYIFRKDIFNKKYKDYYKISIVRNSYERVVSMYFNRFLNVHFPNNGDNSKLKPETFDEFLEIFLPKFWIPVNEDINADGSFIHMSSDQHYQSQAESINKNIDKHINLDNLNDELFDVYENIINVSDETLVLIKKVLNDKKEMLLRNISKNIIKLKFNNYNFKKDKLNLNILYTGVPSNNQMITEQNALLIKKYFKDEIEYHNFGYSHLL